MEAATESKAVGAVIAHEEDSVGANSGGGTSTNDSGVGMESTSGGSSSNNKSKAVEPPPVVINRETRNVYCAKLVMIAVLSMTAVASAMATFLFTTNEVDGDFEEQVRCRTNYRKGRDRITTNADEKQTNPSRGFAATVSLTCYIHALSTHSFKIMLRNWSRYRRLMLIISSRVFIVCHLD